MLVKNLCRNKKMVLNLLNREPRCIRGDLLPMVRHLLNKRDEILRLADKYPTPFYLLDEKELIKSIRLFIQAFNKYLPGCEFYYAMKVNHHPYIIKTVLKHNFGLDVSSGRELEIALQHQAKKVVFTGPGKIVAELELAVRNSNLTTINIDSFGELEKLRMLTKKYDRPVKAGVRIFINTKHHGSWTKFGIPLCELKNFWTRAKKSPLVRLQGIQFHTSWNRDDLPYRNTMKELAIYLKKNFNEQWLKEVKFIDFGGGYRPYLSEGYYPWKLPQGGLMKIAADYFMKDVGFIDKYYLTEAVPINVYAEGIAKAVRKYIDPLVRCAYYTEPGRIICNNTMHIVLRIVDIKKQCIAIADGGINIIGWERFEHDYFPLINLTHPSNKEINYEIYGSLCIPQDIWGHYCYASKLMEGDIVLVPYQGALTYSLAQNFIKPIPKVYLLEGLK